MSISLYEVEIVVLIGILEINEGTTFVEGSNILKPIYDTYMI